MWPVLFHLGDTPIYSYGILGAVGFLFVVAVTLGDARKKGWERQDIVDLLFYGALAGLVGARAFHVLQMHEQMNGPMDWINFRTGGMVFYGAPIVGLPVAFWWIRHKGLPLWEVLDSFGKALPMGHAISRVGCVLAGCCYGLPTDLPWGITYTHPHTVAPHDVALHPSQLYEAGLLVILSLALFAWDRRPHRPGSIILGYLGSYAVLRWVVELFRGDVERGFFMEPVFGELLSMSQGISICLLAGVAVVYWIRGRSAPEEAKSAA